MGSEETWRVVDDRGVVHAVTARQDSAGWTARDPERHDSPHTRAVTARRVIVRIADRLGWEVAEIRGPGEATTAEQLAAVTAERDALRAALRMHAEPCPCGAVATLSAHDGAFHACDQCSRVGRFARWSWVPLPHADALRALNGVTDGGAR